MFEDEWELYEGTAAFDEQVEQFKDSLRQSVKEEVQEKIRTLEAELEELREFRDRKDEIERQYRESENELRRQCRTEIEKIKNTRLYGFLNEIRFDAWAVDVQYVEGPKCDKCDARRQISFISPMGRKMNESCRCAKRQTVYSPKRVKLVSFRIRKYSAGEEVFDRVYAESDSEYTDDMDKIFAESVIQGDFDCSAINQWRSVFVEKEDCQKYCDWLNAEEMKI